eukprot:947698_1
MCDRKLNSPYIVALYDLIETKKYLYIVMEKCQLDGDHFNEEDCCLILHQIAKGVKYMHECGIVHRDLKPENILCVRPQSIKKVKIADFGISKMIGNSHSDLKKKQMETTVGTISYTAPEILLKKRYDYTVDFWSIGVIMFILLCGYPPFWGDDDREVTKSILNEVVELEDEDLVRGLLCKDASKRASCDDILKLAWKVSSKSLSFAKARKNFKQTVIKRKFHRHSLSVFEKDPLLSRKLNVRYGGISNTKNMKRVDSNTLADMSKGKHTHASLDDLTKTKEAHAIKQNKMKNAFRGPRKSKGTEQLMDLQKLPLNQNDSLFAITEENDHDQ